MNQNLLIVDDEYDALAWLEEMFKYEFDREIDVYSAPCAAKALELLNRIKFDVVLTDVRMPGMDGITLFQKIKANWPRCKTVFLTGYRNFDDMYQIINHRDVRFILKSERDEVIQQAVRAALDEFRMELEQENLNQIQQEDLEKARYWMQKEFIGGLLKGEIPSSDEMREQAGKLPLPLRLQDPFLMTLVRIDSVEKGNLQGEEMEVVYQGLRKNLPQDLQVYMHRLENQQAVFLVQPMNRQYGDWNRIFAVWKGAVEYAQVSFRRNCCQGFSAVVASTPACFGTMAGIYANLRQILVGYLGSEQEVVVHAEAVAAGRKEEKEGSAMGRVPLLKSYLELQRRMSYFELLDQLCEELGSRTSRHDTHAMELYYSISVMLLQFINERKLNEKIAFRIGLFKLTKADEHGSWEEAARYLFEVSVAVFELLGENEHILSDRALQRVLDYISGHLSGDLTLTRLAEVGGFNASYLSRLFKQNMQVSISDYVYQKRMELAGKMLAQTNRKIQEIGEEAGYPSAQSFARTFRSYAGISPAEYRELHRKEVKEC